MINQLKFPLIIAHRGYSIKYPENTIIAFQKAKEAKEAKEPGSVMVELDVTLTKDRQLVVIHDDTVDRTTNARGKVKDFTLARLRSLDAGTWFDSVFSREKIPVLEEVMDIAGKDMMINIEIKSSAFEKNSPSDAVEKQVVDLVLKKGALNRVIISSFEPGILKSVSQMEKKPAISFLSDRPLDNNQTELCKNLNVYSWNTDHRVIRKKDVEKMHALGFRVFAYTVNSLKRYKKLVNMGVDGFFTDNPFLLMESE